MTTLESNKLIADSCGIKVIEDGLVDFTHWSIINPEPEPKELLLGENWKHYPATIGAYDPSTNMNQLIEAYEKIREKRQSQLYPFIDMKYIVETYGDEFTNDGIMEVMHKALANYCKKP